MLINTIQDLKTALRQGQWAWPGGYPCYFITSDGEALSFDAVKANYRLVFDAVRNCLNDGWRVSAVDINYEDQNLHCADTGERIESAYATD